jgi:hypothetical protein
MSSRGTTPEPEGDADSARNSAWITPDLVALTLKVWQPLYRGRLSRDDAVAMLLAVGRLFLVLAGEQHHEAVRCARTR